MEVTFRKSSNALVTVKSFLLVVIFGFIVCVLVIHISEDLASLYSINQICFKAGICHSVTSCTDYSCKERPDVASPFPVRKIKRLLKQNQTSAVTCMKLLGGGSYFKYDDWRPDGCKLHMYTPQDVQSCIRRPNNQTAKPFIAFMGDSRVRQLYNEFIGFIKLVDDDRTRKQENLRFDDVNLDIAVEFKWCPYTSSMIADLQRWNRLPASERPSVIMLSCGTWPLAYSPNLNTYADNIRIMRPLLDNMSDTTLVMWILQEKMDETATKRRQIWGSLSNDKYDHWNREAVNVLNASTVFIWSTVRSISSRFLNESSDGLHVPYRANYWHIQLLYNMFCNDYMDHDDATCCKYTKKKLFRFW